jgi:hypothetical protein
MAHQYLNDGEEEEAHARPAKEDDLRKLEAQGFTEDEINRLVELSERLNASTLKRLQFTKWLVDQGLLDEFSVRTE